MGDGCDGGLRAAADRFVRAGLVRLPADPRQAGRYDHDRLHRAACARTAQAARQDGHRAARARPHGSRRADGAGLRQGRDDADAQSPRAVQHEQGRRRRTRQRGQSPRSRRRGQGQRHRSGTQSRRAGPAGSGLAGARAGGRPAQTFVPRFEERQGDRPREVDASGRVTSAAYEPKGSTTDAAELVEAAKAAARKARFTESRAAVQGGTITYVSVWSNF